MDFEDWQVAGGYALKLTAPLGRLLVNTGIKARLNAAVIL